MQCVIKEHKPTFHESVVTARHASLVTAIQLRSVVVGNQHNYKPIAVNEKHSSPHTVVITTTQWSPTVSGYKRRRRRVAGVSAACERQERLLQTTGCSLLNSNMKTSQMVSETLVTISYLNSVLHKVNAKLLFYVEFGR